MFRIPNGLVCSALLMLAFPQTLVSQNPGELSATDLPEFKIETKIFGDDPQSAVSHNRTLFSETFVFDFRFSMESVDEPLEVAIFDANQRQFILLDSKREIRLKLDNLQLLRILDGMGKDLQENEKTGFLVFEEFQEDYQVQSNRVTVSNDFIWYSATGERPKNESVLKRYFEFLDPYTLLSVSDPGRMPPFARLRLNSAVKKYGFIPTQVSLVVKPSEFNRFDFQASSRHKIEVKLDASDKKLIETAKKNWVEFRAVELAEYRGLATVEASKPGRKRR